MRLYTPTYWPALRSYCCHRQILIASANAPQIASRILPAIPSSISLSFFMCMCSLLTRASPAGRPRRGCGRRECGGARYYTPLAVIKEGFSRLSCLLCLAGSPHSPCIARVHSLVFRSSLYKDATIKLYITTLAIINRDYSTSISGSFVTFLF